MAEFRILQIASGREINGAVVYCQTLCRELAVRGHHVTQLCRPGSWLTTQPTLGFSRKESTLKRFPPGEVRALAKWIRSEGFDLIHTHMSRAHTLGILARWHVDIPVVATAHNQYFQLHWRLNDFVIANSQSTADFHSRVNRVPRHKIMPIFCLIDHKRFLS
ncbi:MAG TPA: glycosyltransferase family 4 protein, partial [Pirellulaceae bacterium]|nr:glycosyltransferase family 4 protein [Pirellulaceae bacterium]